MRNSIKHFEDPHFKRSFFLAIVFLFASLIINFYAGTFASHSASNSVTDIILSNTRAYDLDGIFVYGTWLFVLFIIYLCLTRIKQMPFIVKSISLFVIIRALFITLTHIGPFPNEMTISPQSFLNYFVFGADLFFSGHTGLPFLLALVFWDETWLRRTFITISCVFGVVVLLSHLHYTIDVLSAFFISFGIYHIALKIFPKEYQFFLAHSKK